MSHQPDRYTNRSLVNPQTEFERREVARMVAKWAEAVVVDGVPRWKSNNAAPMTDMLDVWKLHGTPDMEFDYAKAVATRASETSAFLAEYRKRDRGPSAEQMTEMRAAFGAGVTVMNIITGRKTRL